MLSLHLEEKEENLYAKLQGKLTRKETYKIEGYIIPYIKQGKVKNFYCDCQKLTKIDAEGRHTLLRLKVFLKRHKGVLVLQNVKEELKNELKGYRMRIQG